jgi:hypothetical protein
MGDIDAAGPFVFITPERGFVLDGRGNIQSTVDAGRTWHPGYACGAADDLRGLTRGQGCQPAAIAFAPDLITGYVVTRALDDHASLVIKTSDGGTTWIAASRIPAADGSDASLVFTDASTGFVRAGGELRMTSDGGQSWHQVVATVPQGHPKVLFAGPMGWMMEGNEFSYTMDAGRRWSARTMNFPTRIVSFSVPAREAAYVVGSHGMIYRYRVVPFNYAVPNMLELPAMAGLTAGGS